MAVDQHRKPDPRSYYESQGLVLTKGRKWVTGPCAFHGGSDSMRFNLSNGAFVCMAGCGARGGDVLAYHMALQGIPLKEAAIALGCWEGDKKMTSNRPTPFSPLDGIKVLAAEANLVAIAGANIAHGVVLTQVDLERVMTATNRILKVMEVYQ